MRHSFGVIPDAPEPPECNGYYDKDRCQFCSEHEKCRAQEEEEAEQIAHWIKDVDNTRRWDRVRFYCSRCKHWQTYGETAYCCHCGAKMEGQTCG